MTNAKSGLWIALPGGVALALLALAGAATAAQGLWAGTATLNAVSTVNHGEPDLGFDLAVQGITREHVLLPSGSSGWEYGSASVDPAWATGGGTLTGAGSAPLGSGFAAVVTEPAPAAGAVFLRRPFTVAADVDGYAQLRLRLWRDDGVVVYLNGTEVARNNLGAGSVPVPADAFSLSEVGDNLYLEFPLPAGDLQAGTNWVAAQVHRSAAADPDWLFDLELAATLEVPLTATLVAERSSGWEYSDATPAAGWTTGNGWSTAVAPIGYGNDGEETLLTYGADPKPAVTYFRRGFEGGTAAFTHLRFLLRRDDGAVVYLNGAEAFRSNLPTGPISPDTAPQKALGPSEETRYVVEELDLRDWQGAFLPGGNTVAVQVHQHPNELAARPDTPTPVRTPAELNLRLLVHVDAQGEARLLKEVIELYDESAGELVLVTDDTLVPAYSGVSLRDGERVGRRISAVGFDWEGRQALACGPGFAPTGTVACPEFALAGDHPSNPFLHRYHPDHDNWDTRYENPAAEAYDVTRKVTLAFSPRYPPNPDLPARLPPPGWGYTAIGGTYQETLTGLHRDAITTLGWFQLDRVTDTARLEP